MEIALETITPDKAMEYLKHNTNNYRSLNKERVQAYAADMKSGNWQMNGEAIKFDKKQELKDGQTRLNAIIVADTPVDMLVIRGIDDGVSMYDIGQARSLGQIAKARGVLDGWHNEVISTARFIVNNGKENYRIGKVKVLQYAERHTDILTKSARYSSLGSNKGICKKSSIIAAIYCLIRSGYPESEIAEFFRIANSGVPHGQCDPSPALVFRNMVQTYNVRITEHRKLLFSAAINSVIDFCSGKSRSMKYKFSDESFNMLSRIRMLDGFSDTEGDDDQ